MKFGARWLEAYESRDRDALEKLIDDDFVYVRHQSGKEIVKEEMLNIWSTDGPRPKRRNYRIIYENDDIAVSHQFIDFPSGDKEAVMVVMLLRNGKVIRMETGATPMPS
ncbi:MAG: nuclear transport factor 2 family protein [Desulfobacterales bacterium]